MKHCSHCGQALADGVEICMNCGCYAEKKHTLTLKRESQWFLVNPPVNVTIVGEGIQQEKALKNGETVAMPLTPGKYHLHFYCSVRSADVDLNLNKDTAYRIGWNRFSGKLEVWEI